MESTAKIAYFSMEVALLPEMPTYSGGLGVLAGDFLRSAAELRMEMVGVTLLHRQGYFRQTLDAAGRQTEAPCPWVVSRYLRELPVRVQVSIEGRTVALRAWQYEVRGPAGFVVPVLFLDTDLPENTEWDRRITDRLYGGDAHYRLCQETVLGIGGIRMLRALNFDRLRSYHMNEGHAALLGLELLDASAHADGRREFSSEDVKRVRERCIFTTHTPVPAGHDKFPLDLVGRVLGRSDFHAHREVFCCEGVLNLTHLALNLSRFHNGVARSHGEVSQLMFPRYVIDSITNGVHAATWTGEPFQKLFDRFVPEWRADNHSLRNALRLPLTSVQAAHQQAKELLLAHVRKTTGLALKPNVFTIGFARRATPYKRADLLFTDLNRLRKLASVGAGLQILYAGKAHPADAEGKGIIEEIVRCAGILWPRVQVAFLPNYELELARLLVAGADLWVNTPQPPMEASGTSGMKAALNGVPSLSVLDGWWVEGHIEGVTGWSVGAPWRSAAAPGDHDRERDAASLYAQLEGKILPLFYREPLGFTAVMRNCIALNGSFFNTHRMLTQYAQKAYLS